LEDQRQRGRAANPTSPRCRIRHKQRRDWTYELDMPDDQAVSSLAPAVRLLVSEDSLPVLAEIVGRFGQRANDCRVPTVPDWRRAVSRA
jgi:hypothetical protein